MNISLSELGKNKKVYFASDFHLGIPNPESSLIREKKIVNWLNQISVDAHAIFLVGDIFDFWFEYKHVVPKGNVRLFGKLAELTDQGIQVFIFSGNHDLWLKDYLPNEIGVVIINEPISITIDSKKFYIAHGDGLGPGDRKYKFFKKIFTNKVCQWLFKWFHPDLGISLASYWSQDSRLGQINEPLVFLEEKEWLVIYSREIEKNAHHDYYIYGHRHIPNIYKLSENSTYFNLGEWVHGSSFAVFQNGELSLELFE